MQAASPSPTLPFETLANSISQFAWVADETGHIYWYNQRWFDYTGTTLEQMRGWGWRDCHHPEHVDRVVALITEAFTTGTPWEDTFPLRGKDGAYRWFLSRAMPIRDDKGNVTHWFGTNTDISEQRAMAEEMAKQRERFAELFEQAPSFMALLRGPTHKFEFANPAYHRLIGHRDLIGRTVAAALPDAAAQGYVDILDEVYRTGAPYTANGAKYAMQLYPDGPVSERFVDFVFQPMRNAAGAIGGIFVEGTDVTARTLAENARFEAEQRFEIFAETMANHVWTSDANGQLDWFNRQVYAYSGSAPGDLDGEKWAKLVHPDDVSGASTRWATALASGETYETQFRLRRADGAYRWHIARATPIHNAAGEITRWIGTNTDIEEQKEATAEVSRFALSLEQRVSDRTRDLTEANATLQIAIGQREAAEAQVRQMQKIEALGQLTGGIAHDFNNMLAVIIGALNLTERRLARGDTDVNGLLKGALDGATRAATLTQRLLAFSRQQPLAPDVIEPNRLVAGMSEMLRRTLSEATRLEIVQGGGLWKIHADQSQLENALLNLAINAQDAMPDGGKITIETANTHLDEDYVLANPGPAPGQYVLIAMTDTGTGMSPEIVAKVFEPFFTTKGVGKGTGLGLSQVYGFVRQSKGHIKVYSEVGHGTTVKIYLPRLYQDQASLDRHTAEKARASPKGVLTDCILVLEDDERMREITVSVLRELGYSVLHSSSPLAALKILENNPQITLLFTDVVMPDMTGRQVADKAAILRPDLKILFTTGYTRNAIVHNGTLDAGVNFIAKPFTVDQLARKVRDVLDT